MNCSKCGQLLSAEENFCPTCGSPCESGPTATPTPTTAESVNITAESIILPETDKEKILPGILGAFLFSLAGGVVCFILYQLNIVAALSGVVGIICAMKGYEKFAGKLSKLGVIVSVLASIASIVVSLYISLGVTIYMELSSQYAITLFDGIASVPLFLENPKVSSAFFSDMAMCIAFCIIGCIGYAVRAFKSANNPRQMNNTINNQNSLNDQN